MRSVCLGLVAVWLGIAAQASAGPLYIGYDIQFADYQEPGLSADIYAMGLKVGVELTECLALEARASSGLQDDRQEVLGMDVTFELDHTVGAYLKGMIPFDEFRPYVLAGYTSARATASTFGVTMSETASDISFGLGLELRMSERVSLGIEHLRLVDQELFELSSTGMSLNFSF